MSMALWSIPAVSRGAEFVALHSDVILNTQESLLANFFINQSFLINILGLLVGQFLKAYYYIQTVII